jgi:Zn-dependent protease
MFGTGPSFQFRLFGIPVQVSLFFLLLVVLIGQRDARGSPLLLVSWVVIAFLSVLLHELGHAGFARLFGRQPFVFLYGLGGLTTWRQQGEMAAGRRFVVSLAGPAIGLVIGVLALIAYYALRGSSPTGATIARYVVWANLGWGILNLIPMLPLDGGHMMEAVFDLIAPGRGARAARYGSIVTAVVVAPLALAMGMLMMVLYCAFAIWANVQDLRRPAAPPPSAAVIDVPAQPLPADDPPPEQRPS